MKRSMFVGGCALLLGWGAPAVAGTGHLYIPNEAFACVTGTCTKTYTDTQFGQTNHYPITALAANATIAKMDTAFTYPASHLSTNVKFNTTIHYMTGGSGNKTYGFQTRGVFYPDALTGGLFWGDNAFTGCAGVIYSRTANTAAAGYKVSATSLSGPYGFEACDGTSTGPGGQYECVSQSVCVNQPGFLRVERYGNGSDPAVGDTAYVVSVDVSWETP